MNVKNISIALTVLVIALLATLLMQKGYSPVHTGKRAQWSIFAISYVFDELLILFL